MIDVEMMKKARQASVLLAAVLAALAAEEATMTQLGAPVWLVALIAFVAGWFGVRQPGTVAMPKEPM